MPKQEQWKIEMAEERRIRENVKRNAFLDGVRYAKSRGRELAQQRAPADPPPKAPATRGKPITEMLQDARTYIQTLQAAILGMAAQIDELNKSLPPKAPTSTAKAATSATMTSEQAIAAYNKLPPNDHQGRAAFREKHAVALGITRK